MLVREANLLPPSIDEHGFETWQKCSRSQTIDECIQDRLMCSTLTLPSRYARKVRAPSLCFSMREGTAGLEAQHPMIAWLILRDEAIYGSLHSTPGASSDSYLRRAFASDSPSLGGDVRHSAAFPCQTPGLSLKTLKGLAGWRARKAIYYFSHSQQYFSCLSSFSLPSRFDSLTFILSRASLRRSTFLRVFSQHERQASKQSIPAIELV